MQLDYTSLAGLLAAAEQAGRPLSELVLAQQAAELEQPPEQVYDRMARCYQVMADGVAPGCDPDLRSASGLSGGSAAKMKAAVEGGRTLTGPVLGGALTRALAISELNAAMGRIVAAPTAGSCGILPAALLTMEQEKGCSRRSCRRCRDALRRRPAAFRLPVGGDCRATRRSPAIPDRAGHGESPVGTQGI